MSAKIRFAIFIIAVGISLYILYPTYAYYKMGNKLPQKKREKLRDRAITLGLDLVGGMHLILEVDKSKLSKEEAKGAVERAINVIQNRIDQFGVYEPVIQKIGKDRILIQLPGVDRDRAISLIGQTAQLEFKLLAPPDTTVEVFKRIDAFLRGDTTLSMPSNPDSAPFFGVLRTLGPFFVVEEENIDSLKNMIEKARHLIPPAYEILFGPTEEVKGKKLRKVYLIRKKAELRGGGIKEAYHGPYRGNDPSLQNTWAVYFKLSSKDAVKFSRITEKNVGRWMAIVLDSVVRSAARIKEKIPPGSSVMITTGEKSPDRAKDIAIVLRSGALPAPVKIAEERSVGPSLGSDSIRKGLKAALIGAILVVLFMVIYYSLSGLLADLALGLNVLFLLAVLALLRASLTLPGIAGIALTIGMAVDANVLILERIKEELRAGKPVRTAIDLGYKRAFVTILDANITTIITAVVLYFMGTGPIKGFATTLIIGLVINIITAVFFTRSVYDLFLEKRKPIQKLAI